MKRSPDFLLRQVAGKQVAVPVGQASVKFHGMLTLNGTSAYVWQLLEQEQTIDSLTQAMCARYEVDADTARNDVTAFVEKLRAVGAIIGE